MSTPTYSPPAEPVATALIPVSLADIDAALLARLLLQPHPQVLIDCQAQPCRRNVGVCYFLSQLLMLRQQGASVWLSNVDASLRGHLRQLGLEAAFLLADQGSKALAILTDPVYTQATASFAQVI